MQNNLVLEITSKAAYEAAVGFTDAIERFDIQLWKNLPEYVKEYWKKIAEAVLVASKNCDMGDLE